MNWDAIGVIGEVFGAIAVIVTLVYLAGQLRQNTRALQAASMDSTTQTSNDIRETIYSDPAVTKIYLDGLADPDSFEALDRERFRLLLTNAFWAMWNTYAQSELSGRESWSSQRNILVRTVSSPGGRWFWDQYGTEFDPKFQLEVQGIIRELSGSNAEDRPSNDA